MNYYICKFSDYGVLPSKLYPDHSEDFLRVSNDGLKFIVRSDTDTPTNGDLSWMNGSEPVFNDSEIKEEIKKTNWVGSSIPASELGVLISSDSPDLSDFTDNSGGGIFSDGGGKITINQGGYAGFGNSISLTPDGFAHKFTALPKWKFRVKFISDLSPTANHQGLGIGLKSTHYNEPQGLVCRVKTEPGGQEGRVYIYPDGENFTEQEDDSPTFDMIPGTTYYLELEKDNEDVYARLIDSDGSTVLVTESYTYSLTNNSRPMPNTGNFAIYSFGGSRDVTGYEISSKCKQNVDFMIVGDSNSDAHWVQGYINAWGNKYAEKYPNKKLEILGGFGDSVTYEITSRIDEIIALKPRVVMIAGLSNDVAQNIDQTTRRNAYIALVNALEAAEGIEEVRLHTIIPRNGVNLVSENDFIKSFPNRVDDVFAELEGDTNKIDPDYATNDKTHLSILGAQTYADFIYDNDQ